MSNYVTAICRPLRLAPTAKAVLMCLADYCHDDGQDWHSIAAIMDWTCLGKTTVIDALKALETDGLIRIERRFGAKNTTFLQLEALQNLSATRTGSVDQPVRHPHRYQSGSRTGARGEPDRLADSTGTAGVQTGAAPVQTGAAGGPEALEASEKHQEASIPKTRARARKSLCVTPEIPDSVLPEELPRETWRQFTAMRDEMRKPMTIQAQQLMFGRLRRMAADGVSVQEAIEASIRNSWTDVYPPKSLQNKRPTAKAFRSRDYTEGVIDV